MVGDGLFVLPIVESIVVLTGGIDVEALLFVVVVVRSYSSSAAMV